MDTTLVDFNDMRWERGDISFIFNGDKKPGKSLTILDNQAKIYQRLKYNVRFYFILMGFYNSRIIINIIFQETEVEIENEVDILMSSDIIASQMSTKGITFTRAQTGWIFREDKRVCKGNNK